MSSTSTFKVFFENQTRRFQSEVNFDKFKQKLTNLFPTGSRFNLSWKDSDGDIITIVSDDDFQEAYRAQATTGVPKIYAVAAADAASTTITTTTTTSTTTTTDSPSDDDDDSFEIVNNRDISASGLPSRNSSSTNSSSVDESLIKDEENPDNKADNANVDNTDDVDENTRSDANDNVDEQEQEQEHERQEPITTAATTTTTTTAAATKTKAPPPVAPKPKPTITPAVHHCVTCDASGQAPLRGTRYRKVGENFDLNEQEFAKLQEPIKQYFEAILRPGESPIRYEPVVHYGVECDASKANPIFGMRFHKIGEDYDLCQAEFAKLDEKDRRKYEIINHPLGTPVPYFTGADDEEEEQPLNDLFQHLLFGMQFLHPGIEIEIQRRGPKSFCQRSTDSGSGRCGRRGPPRHCHQRQQTRQEQQSEQGRGQGQEHPQEVKTGDVLPSAAPSLRFGSFGPGVEQLQRFLITHGLMNESAIRWRAGVYAWRTAQAIARFQQENGITVEELGTFDKPTHDALLIFSNGAAPKDIRVATPDTSSNQKQQQPRETQEIEEEVYTEQEPSEAVVKSSITADSVGNNNDNCNVEYDQIQSNTTAKDVDVSEGQPPALAQNDQKQEPEPDQPQPSQRWGDQLNALRAMGFDDDDRHTVLLDRYRGNVDRVVASLLE